MYCFRCQACDLEVRRILTVDEAKAELRHGKGCEGLLTREVKPPSSQAVETLDNGFMSRRLERLVDAERLYQERADATKKSRTGGDGR
jgi:hypothetical protein